MKAKLSWVSAVVILLGSALAAQDISGMWQAIVNQNQQKLKLRMTIEKKAEGGWTGKLYYIGRFQDWGLFTPAQSITVNGPNIKLSAARIGAFEGVISADGSSIQGTLTQAKPIPVTFERATPATEWKDLAPHTVQFVTVDENIKLEVLDFGGTGRPLVFLGGGGSTAHSWDTFAPKFVPAYHAYAITRRGFGDSSAPPCGYAADRMGDDVIGVLDALKLERPVLVGLSIGGEELSSVGSRHPERVSGLIYLDAAYEYAYYDSAHEDLDIDSADLRNKLMQLQAEQSNAVDLQLIKEILAELPKVKKELLTLQKDLQSDPTHDSGPLPFALPLMFQGFTKYTKIPVPILAIYAYPHDSGETDPKKQAEMDAQDKIYTGRQADAFEKGVPTARVVRLPHARHNVVRSNEADVMREMNAFLASLK